MGIELDQGIHNANHYLDVLNDHRNHVSLAHLNIQSITSSFSEFQAMLKQ